MKEKLDEESKVLVKTVIDKQLRSLRCYKGCNCGCFVEAVARMRILEMLEIEEDNKTD